LGARLKDVAERAGVSTATASLVLNNKPSKIVISEATRQQVLKAARELSYRPNLIARAMAKQQTSLVALVVGDVTASFYPEIIAGVSEVLEDHGFSVLLCTCRESLADQEQHLITVNSKMVDGIIITPVFGTSMDLLTHTVDASRPMVVACRVPLGCSLPSVRVDNEQGGYVATRHLIELGHRRIAFLGDQVAGLSPQEQALSENYQRYVGYLKAMCETGLKPLPLLTIPEHTPHLVGGEVAVSAALQQDPKPTAIFACSDIAAIAAIRAAHAAGLRVPEALSVVGFDDLPIADLVTPRLTTVAQPKYDIGNCSGQMLLRLIEGKPVESQILQPTLVVRNSTASLIQSPKAD